MVQTFEIPRRPPFWVLIALQTGISAAGLVVEIVAARMIAPYVGMSLYSWTAIIAVVLAGFSIGHWWGGRLAAQPTLRAFRQTGWMLLAAAISTAAAGLILRLTAGPVIEWVANPMAAFTDIAAPPHLITQKVFRLMASRLNPNGVYVMNGVDNVDRMEAVNALHRTL